MRPVGARRCAGAGRGPPGRAAAPGACFPQPPTCWQRSSCCLRPAAPPLPCTRPPPHCALHSFSPRPLSGPLLDPLTLFSAHLYCPRPCLPLLLGFDSVLSAHWPASP